MRVRAAREACGLSQQALADAIGAKSHQNIYNYERGYREPKFEVLERIAAATNMPLTWFFQDEPAAEPAPSIGREKQELSAKPPSDTASDEREKQELASGQSRGDPDTQSLLAQLVAAQVQMLQAQARGEERADQRHGEMMQALTALTHEQMRTRAEAARTQRRLEQMEAELREMDEGDDADCCEGQDACSG